MHTKFSVSLSCGVTTYWELWHLAGVNTHGQSYGPKFWFQNQDEIDADWHPVEGAQLALASVRKVSGSISTGGNKKRLHGVIGELEVDERDAAGEKAAAYEGISIRSSICRRCPAFRTRSTGSRVYGYGVRGQRVGGEAGVAG